VSLALQVLISGLAAGAVYGLVAIAYVLVYRLTGIVYFAFGDLVGLAVFAALLVAAGTGPVTQTNVGGLRFLAAVVVGALVCVAASTAAYWLAVQPHLVRGSVIGWIAATVAIVYAVRSSIDVFFTRPSYVFPDPIPFRDVGRAGFVTVGDASIQVRSFFVIAVGVGLAALATLVLRRSKLGRGLRAIESDVDGAALVGVPVTRLVAVAFALAGGLAALAAVVAAPSAPFGVEAGSLLGVKALLAALVVGFSSPAAGFVAGLAVGVAESGIANFHAAGFQLGPSYREIVPIALVLAFVAIRAVATERRTPVSEPG
jgi:branched-chain amino acid transport system permease protein